MKRKRLCSSICLGARIALMISISNPMITKDIEENHSDTTNELSTVSDLTLFGRKVVINPVRINPKTNFGKLSQINFKENFRVANSDIPITTAIIHTF